MLEGKMSGIILQNARLHCPIERASALFTRNELLPTWLTRVADVEPVVDGRYELFWDLDDPTRNSTLGCKITALEADTLLAFEDRAAAFPSPSGRGEAALLTLLHGMAMASYENTAGNAAGSRLPQAANRAAGGGGQTGVVQPGAPAGAAPALTRPHGML
jgi:uncharacterized protein YndB with AHSA1/START domain